MKKVKWLSESIVFGLSVLVGCVDVEPVSKLESEPIYTETYVQLNADGTEIVTMRQITASEQLAENNAREQLEHEKLKQSPLSITHDLTCASASMWIQDGINQSGNRICFAGTGVADLSKYCRISVSEPPPLPPLCTDWWDGDLRSFWAGSDFGVFGSSTRFDCVGSCEFDRFQKENTALCMGARFLGLGQRCTPD